MTFIAAPGLAQIELIDLLPGYTLGQMHGTSADGSTLAADMFINDSVRYDAYAWRDGDWSSLPRYNDFNQWQGISADGQITLSVSSLWGSQGRLVRVENGVRNEITFGLDDRRIHAALTRDGQTALFTRDSIAPGSVELYRYQANDINTTQIGALSDRYVRSNGVLGGGRDDFFVINAEIIPNNDGVGGMTRALVFNDGQTFEIPTFSHQSIIHSRATGMTADGNVVVGVEYAREIDSFETEERSWIYRNGAASEITLDGYDHFSISSITDDATAWVGAGYNDDGTGSTFLIYESGRAISVEELLASEGVLLETEELASLQHISANGAVASGVISRGNYTQFGSEVTLFTIAVPAPSTVLPLFGIALVARRRR